MAAVAMSGAGGSAFPSEGAETDPEAIAARVIRQATASGHRPIRTLRCFLVVLGDQAVGKTSWLSFLQKATFSKPYRMTSVPETHVLTVAVEDEERAVAKERAAAGIPLTRVEFHALDAPGNEVFYPLNTGDATWHRADAVVLMYDPSVRDTFTSLGKWRRRLSEQVSRQPRGVVIANKCDLDQELRTVPDDDGRELAESLGMTFHAISVKDGTSAKDPLRALAREISDAFAEAAAAAAAASTE